MTLIFRRQSKYPLFALIDVKIIPGMELLRKVIQQLLKEKQILRSKITFRRNFHKRVM